MLLWDKMTTLRDPHMFVLYIVHDLLFLLQTTELCLLVSSCSEGRYSHHDFITLPPRSEYPDYYEIIKKPVW